MVDRRDVATRCLGRCQKSILNLLYSICKQLQLNNGDFEGCGSPYLRRVAAIMQVVCSLGMVGHDVYVHRMLKEKSSSKVQAPRVFVQISNSLDVVRM